MWRTVIGVFLSLALCGLALTSLPGTAGATPRPRKPSAPTSLTAIPVDTAIAVSWAAPRHGAPINSYVVTVSPGKETCTPVANSCLVTGLTNGRKYHVKVKAVNGVGAGRPAMKGRLEPNTAQNCSYVGAYGNLQGCNLSGGTLSNVNLTDADLYGTNLYGTSLDGANLTGVNAQDADLYHADLVGADLSDANLTDADLNGATLSNYVDNTLVAADINGANLTNDMATAADAQAQNNYLDVMEWGGLIGTPTNLPAGWVFTDGYLLGPGIAPSGPYGADLSDGELADVDLSYANLTTADLTDADMTNANLTSTDLYGATFTAGTILTGVTWSATTCPDGNDSDDVGYTCVNDGA